LSAAPTGQYLLAKRPFVKPERSEVDDWFDGYDNPQKEVLLYLRRRILASDPPIRECIKWKSPTFTKDRT
jgi:uncharacterized protein YdhG (YjbR/CyaY superfamily)